MNLDPRKRFGPEQKRAHDPPGVKTRSGILSPLSLTDGRVPPVRFLFPGNHSLPHWNGNRWRYSLPRSLRALIGHQDPTYKSPQRPSVDPLSSPYPRRRQGNAIAHRSPQPLRASPAKFIVHGEPRTPSPLLTFLPHPGAPADALVLLYFAAKRRRGTHPKHHRRTVEAPAAPPHAY
jgi:hypothetical protein